jgi:TonB-dependent Receptor Plug Domain
MPLVRGVPGVTLNDDFESRFSLQGAGFNRIGVYLDGILLHQPVHTVRTDASGSAIVFNADLVDQLELYKGAFLSVSPTARRAHLMCICETVTSIATRFEWRRVLQT